MLIKKIGEAIGGTFAGLGCLATGCLLDVAGLFGGLVAIYGVVLAWERYGWSLLWRVPLGIAAVVTVIVVGYEIWSRRDERKGGR